MTTKTRINSQDSTSETMHDRPARCALPRALEVAAIQRKASTGDVSITTAAIRAAFEQIGYKHTLTPTALQRALIAAGAFKSNHSTAEGTRYAFPDAKSRMEAVRMAARNIAQFELAAMEAKKTTCGATRTPTARGCLVSFA